MIELGVNIDHVATLRQARRGKDPDVIAAAKICELAGAHQITCHLRQDRRHIQDRDVELLKQVLHVRLNLEMAAVDEIMTIAQRIKPHTVCLVPEKREEITTEGGLDVAGQRKRLTEVVRFFHDSGIKVSMFIDPEVDQVNASAETGADYVELHTGAYANAASSDIMHELNRLATAAARAINAGLVFNAGHGLTVRNLPAVAAIPGLNEVNIGHSIISRAVFIGLENAVREIIEVLHRYSK
ncbi:MAG TPA: pyridoxine 5'-phosphate synthase [Candidatus Hydrogenedentes bacterium]|nr:pyridoxine 5'-phosphate synthase [Candidatus Hydrogenedentota bacterium]HOL77433.1 pyridoxine 5'-phosphate synthase [Candidatus Hydrogenedentota bacterium]HPO84576.1 pyridoxine 5'-phosphate synthase [Candidatus Hydrogenedentota bacterium]